MTDTARTELRQERGVVRRDLVLDAVTVVLLVAALLLPWDAAHRGFEDVPLRVAAFIAAISVLVPHAVRWDGLPLPWPAVSAAKSLLVLPLAMITLERAALLAGHGRHTGPPQLAVLGLAALLSAVAAAVQPRSEERLPPVRRGWGLAALLLGAAAVLAEPASTAVETLGSWGAWGQVGTMQWAFVIAALLVPGAAIATTVVLAARDRVGWRHCAAVLGLTLLALVWLDGLHVAGRTPVLRSLPDGLTVALLVLAVAAMVAALPAGTPGPVPPAPSAVACGRAGLVVLLVHTATQVVLLPVLVAVGIPFGPWGGFELLGRVLLVGALVLALVLLRRPTRTRRRAAAGLALLPCLAGATLLVVAVLNRPEADGAVLGSTFAPLELTLTLGAGIYSLVALLDRPRTAAEIS
jgi:hypothetical protein